MNTTADPFPDLPWWRRNAGRLVFVALALVVLALVVLALWLWPTVALFLEDKLGAQLMGSHRSHDGLLKLDVSKRYALPATDLFDPASIVTARLTDAAGRELVRSSARLLDDSDWQSPGLRWLSNRVEVIGFDRRANQSLSLSYPHSR